MKLFGIKEKKKKKDTYNESLESPEFMSYLKKIEKDSSFKQEGSNFVLFWKAYKRIVGYGIRYASDKIKRKKWREVYGILVGSIENNFVFIKDAIPMIAGQRAGVEYEDKQYVDMAEIDYKIYEKALKDKKKDFIIGWWHTHPGFGFFFSPVDSLTQLGYQTNNPNAIGLIFDHTEKNNHSLGISGLRLKNAEKGIPSGYEIVNLFFNPEKKIQLERINEVIKDIQKNQSIIQKKLTYIQEKIINRDIAKLRKIYGVIPIPKTASDDIPLWKQLEKSYTWDATESETQYLIPPFRQALEERIANYQKILKRLDDEGNFELYEQKKELFKKNVLTLLEKPKNLCIMLLKDLHNKMKFLNPFWDYLDTNERLLCNNAFNQISIYTETINKVEVNAFSKIG
jgi:proteasome lid subunit RPN8/RPN11